MPLNDIINQKNKEYLRLVISMVGVVDKTDDGIHVLSTIKIYSYFSLVLPSLSKSCWKHRKWCSYFENRYHPVKMVEKKKLNFSVSPVVFQKRKYQFFCRSFGSCPLQLPDQLHCDYVRISVLKCYQYCSGYILVENGNLNTETKCKVCSNLLASIREQLSVFLLVFFKKNFEHLSHPILVLLF